MEKIDPTLCFIICHRHVKGYESYLKYYIDNITSFYRNAKVIIVDNNSTDLSVALGISAEYPNVTLITNESDGKFEIGGYNFGLKYLHDNLLLEAYDYVILVQDTFILKNRFDFNILKDDNVLAGSIANIPNDEHFIHERTAMLEALNIANTPDAKMCWCNCLFVSRKSIKELYEILKNIKITTRRESEASERYLGNILYYLNNNSSVSIDKDNMYTVDGVNFFTCHETYQCYKDVKSFFCKISQCKNERTTE